MCVCHTKDYQDGSWTLVTRDNTLLMIGGVFEKGALQMKK